MTRYRPYKAPEYTVPPLSPDERDELSYEIAKVEEEIYALKSYEHKLYRLLQNKHIDIE